jgi:hypothetical protein
MVDIGFRGEAGSRITLLNREWMAFLELSIEDSKIRMIP